MPDLVRLVARSFNSDVSKLAEAGWTARIGLEDGLRSTVDWFHAHHAELRE